MKHLFVVNPVAGGKRNDVKKVIEKIKSEMADLGGDYEIYMTKAPLDACRKVREEAESGAELRVYACGGDGTLNECANGAVGFPNAAVTHYPCGTGNDFIKIFGSEASRFFDVRTLVDGEIRPIDIIECGGRYSVNICSVGIDARIGADVHKYSHLPIVGGAAGYVVSLLANFAKGINNSYIIRTENETLTGEFALVCACNGRYYGGGFNPVREAMPDDGIIDFLIVSQISRLRSLTVLGKYARGDYAKMPDLIRHIRGKYLELESMEEYIINLDGETICQKKTCFKMISGGINFIFPRDMAFFKNRSAKNNDNMSKNEFSAVNG
ncbi:MAG: diacylglycerol kinase family protein [Oscillospiraceae bacterium]